MHRPVKDEFDILHNRAFESHAKLAMLSPSANAVGSKGFPSRAPTYGGDGTSWEQDGWTDGDWESAGCRRVHTNGLQRKMIFTLLLPIVCYKYSDGKPMVEVVDGYDGATAIEFTMKGVRTVDEYVWTLEQDDQEQLYCVEAVAYGKRIGREWRVWK